MKRAVKPKKLLPTVAAAAVDFPLIAIGASAGGLEACSRLLRRLPTLTRFLAATASRK